MFTVTNKISRELVRGLLCCAFEGGSNYWYTELAPDNYPKGKTHKDYSKGGSMQGDNYWHWCQLLPTTGGSVKFVVIDHTEESNDSNGGAEMSLGEKEILRGLEVMADKYPNHFGDAISGNDDATTGDVFLQCCVFGDVLYG